MDLPLNTLELFKKLNWVEGQEIIVIIISAWVISHLVRWILRVIAENGSPKFRLGVLRYIPILRFSIGFIAAIMIIPIFIEPTFQKIVALTASIGIVLAFVLKDYASSLTAGIITILERPYQPGDWIELDGTYGEVTKITLRAVHLVTPDDNEIIIPHYRFWSKKISNATSGDRSLLCVADFYLHPDHDGQTVLRELTQVAESSPRRKPDSKVKVVVHDKPWGSHYKIKSYVKESREQFDFISDLTIQGKEALRKHNIRYSLAISAVAPKEY